MGFVSSEALGSTLSTVLNFVNLNGEVYNQLYQLNELNVADLAMNLQQEEPVCGQFLSTADRGASGERIQIYLRPRGKRPRLNLLGLS